MKRLNTLAFAALVCLSACGAPTPSSQSSTVKDSSTDDVMGSYAKLNADGSVACSGDVAVDGMNWFFQTTYKIHVVNAAQASQNNGYSEIYSIQTASQGPDGDGIATYGKDSHLIWGDGTVYVYATSSVLRDDAGTYTLQVVETLRDTGAVYQQLSCAGATKQ